MTRDDGRRLWALDCGLERSFDLDREHVVYTCWGGGTPLYVGSSSSVTVRIAAHRAAPWWLAVTKVTYHSHPTREQANACEVAQILAMQPPHNLSLTRASSSRLSRPRVRRLKHPPGQIAWGAEALETALRVLEKRGWPAL